MSGLGDGGNAGEEQGYTKVEGPVLTMMSKRLRALRKKANKIAQIEEARAAGKTINKEQEEVLRAKVSVHLLIDEYEKLKQPLVTSVKEELRDAKQAFEARIAAERAEQHEQQEAEKRKLEVEAEEAAREEQEQAAAAATAKAEEPGTDAAAGRGDEGADVASLVQLLYFGTLFDVREAGHDPLTRWGKEQERNSCLSYDFVADDSTQPLSAADLDGLAQLRRLITLRAQHAPNHSEAFEECLRHAHAWLTRAHDPVEGAPLSYAALQERLDRIVASEFFTRRAENLNPEVAASQAAAQFGFGGQQEQQQQQQQGGYGVDDHGPQQQQQYAPQPPQEQAQLGGQPQPQFFYAAVPEGSSAQVLAGAIPAFAQEGSFTVMDPNQISVQQEQQQHQQQQQQQHQYPGHLDVIPAQMQPANGPHPVEPSLEEEPSFDMAQQHAPQPQLQQPQPQPQQQEAEQPEQQQQQQQQQHQHQQQDQQQQSANMIQAPMANGGAPGYGGGFHRGARGGSYGARGAGGGYGGPPRGRGGRGRSGPPFEQQQQQQHPHQPGGGATGGYQHPGTAYGGPRGRGRGRSRGRGAGGAFHTPNNQFPASSGQGNGAPQQQSLDLP